MKEFEDIDGSVGAIETHVQDRRKNQKPLNSEAAAYYRQVAINMRKARRTLNLTQQQIADSMGLPRSTYKSLESGNTAIYSYHMAKWSKITGYDVRVLTRGSAYDLTTGIDGFELVELIQGLPKDKYHAVLELVKTI
jgi:transcriptional regulator with XRE-family HTH domain